MVLSFWNIRKKNLSDLLVNLVLEQNIDIFILAEATKSCLNEFLYKIESVFPGMPFRKVPSQNNRIIVLSRYNLRIFTDLSKFCTSNRWSSHVIEIENVFKLNLIGVHFNSKNNWSDQSLAFDCVNFARDIALIEENSGSNHTVLMGDFNMNPFEPGMIAANGLHAIQDMNYANDRIEGRIVNGLNYKFFYNPMWNFFGDNSGPAGTYYYRNPGHVSFEWNIFDQVIFRPSLKKHLDGKNYVEIIRQIDGDKLTKVFERPDQKKYSDHLPIILKLTF